MTPRHQIHIVPMSEQIGRGKGKGSIYHVQENLTTPRDRRVMKNKEEAFMKKEYNSNNRFARNNSHVVYFNNKCYKVTGTVTFDGGYSWRCGHAKYHISPTEKNDDGMHYVFQLIGDTAIKVPGQLVMWPEFDQDIYNTILDGREIISKAKWKHKLLSNELMLKMKDELHLVRLRNTTKRKALQYDDDVPKKQKHEYESESESDDDEDDEDED